MSIRLIGERLHMKLEAQNYYFLENGSYDFDKI
jgi:hypothetical protein